MSVLIEIVVGAVLYLFMSAGDMDQHQTAEGINFNQTPEVTVSGKCLN